MRIVDYTTAYQNMSKTRTVQEFGKMLGTNKHKFGQVFEMYPQHTISSLTDMLGNVYEKRSDSKFEAIKSMVIEWSIDVSYIKTVAVAEDCLETGAGRSNFKLYLKEKYFSKWDTMVLEDQTQLFVVQEPRAAGGQRWEHIVRIVGNDYSRQVDLNYLTKGRTVRYRSNYHPELSDFGSVKYHSNTEIYRNFISRHRAAISKSAFYSRQEDIIIEDWAKSKDGKNELVYYKMKPADKACMDSFLASREHNCSFGEANYDQNGKCLDKDDRGMDIPMGDGVVTQLNQFGMKFPYSRLTTGIIEDMLESMKSKSEYVQGNNWTMILNSRAFQQMQRLLKDDLRSQSPNDGTWYYSMAKAKKASTQENQHAGNYDGPYVDLGSTYLSYQFGNNKVTFMEDRALTLEYPDRGYGVIVDTQINSQVSMPNMMMFTLEGEELIEGNLNGLGGQDGKTSGEISTPVSGSELHLMGTSGAVVFNPYRSVILEEAILF